MDNPDLIYHIPQSEISDIGSFLDAIKNRIIHDEINLDYGIFLRGPNRGIKIELVHPDFDSKNTDDILTVHISYEKYVPK